MYNINQSICGFLQISSKVKRSFEKMVKKILLLVALIVVMFSLISCQTVQGIGGDIKWTGEKGAELLEQ
jgi:predicted small secreted protein